MTKDAKILSVQRRWRPSVPRMTAWIVLLGAMLAVAGCGGDSGGGDVAAQWLADSTEASGMSETAGGTGSGSDVSSSPGPSTDAGSTSETAGGAGRGSEVSTSPGPSTDARSPSQDVDDQRVESADCLDIDILGEPLIVPPAGVRTTFRVLRCDGAPVRRLDLQAGEIQVLNNKEGQEPEPFGEGNEGGGAPAVGQPSDVGFFSVLALDMSGSISKPLREKVAEGALLFVKAMVTDAAPDLRHKVAILVFGKPSALEVLVPFTDNDAALRSALEELREGESLGTTDLYGAYVRAIDEVEAVGKDVGLADRFVVLFTDGTHEAGDATNLRTRALEARDAASTTIYTIGLEGAYDPEELRELASAPRNFYSVESSSALAQTFGDVAREAVSRADSNYVVGVCTPVALGSAAMTIRVKLGDAETEELVSYPTDRLDGSVDECDATELAYPCGNRECGASTILGIHCGSCSGGMACNDGGRCADPCEGRECGPGRLPGVNCGECSGGGSCGEDGQCLSACAFDFDTFDFGSSMAGAPAQLEASTELSCGRAIVIESLSLNEGSAVASRPMFPPGSYLHEPWFGARVDVEGLASPVAIDEPGEIVSPQLPVRVEAGAKVSVRVTMTALCQGAKTAALRIRYSDGDHGASQYSEIALTGTGANLANVCNADSPVACQHHGGDDGAAWICEPCKTCPGGQAFCVEVLGDSGELRPGCY